MDFITAMPMNLPEEYSLQNPLDIMVMDLPEEYSQRKVVTKPSISNPKSTKKAKKCASSEVKIKSKPTVKDQKMHRSIFAEGAIPDGTPVVYKNKGKEILDGSKQGRGILCSCCKAVISASQFEVHAGRPDRRKPYEHIFFKDGVSLHAYAAKLKPSGKHLVKKNDNICGVCQNRGDLMFCDGCPRSFHKECIAETRGLLEKWFCKHCRDSMKCLRRNSSDVAGGTVSGINSFEEIGNRCIRVIDNPNKHELIACVLCRSCEFEKNKDEFNDQTVIVCEQCELEFHIGCLKEHYRANLTALPPGNWFCSVECGRLNYVIKVVVTCGAQRVPNSLVGDITNLDVNWLIIHGKHASDKNKLLLAEAADIFHNGFEPIVDDVTERDFIEAMTYGQEINASDFTGVHCAVITTNSKVVTAGLFRVFGHEIVELAIVATRQQFKGKGYFKLFFTCFEKLLSYLKIKKVVVPATEEAISMWMKKFGFRQVTPLERSEYRQKQTSMVAFTGTCLLEKNVPEGRITFEDNAFFSLSMG